MIEGVDHESIYPGYVKHPVANKSLERVEFGINYGTYLIRDADVDLFENQQFRGDVSIFKKIMSSRCPFVINCSSYLTRLTHSPINHFADMRFSSTKSLRAVHIKFDLYSDAPDRDFKIELMRLMINSLHELLLAATETFNSKDNQVFNQAAHKSKSTATLLADEELTKAIEQLKESFASPSESSQLDLIHYLNELCESIIQSLREQIELLSMKA